MRIAEPEFAAMQRRHRRGQAETKAGTGQGPAGFQPHEPLHRVLAVAFGNAGAMVGDAEQHLVALAPRLDQDLLRSSHDLRIQRLHRSVRLAVFDRVLDQIGQRLADQLAVAVQRAPARS